MKESDRADELETYLKKYPQGRFFEVASVKLNRLRGSSAGLSGSAAGGANARAGEAYTDPTTGMEFVFVPGGCFQMGDPFGNKDEMPVHEVCVDGFFMSKYEVTQGEYLTVTGSNPSESNKGDRYPVENVGWEEAQSFIRSLNGKSGEIYRLPTEAEWEYAARSGGRKHKYERASNQDDVAWYSENSAGKTHQVGTKSPNSIGLYDMSGNVREWCGDWYSNDYYVSSPRQNPLGPSYGMHRVNRGGGWNDNSRNVRSSFRGWVDPDFRFAGLGFRLVLQASATGQ